MNPTKYKGEETDKLYLEMSKDGRTEVEIAAALEVTTRTFLNWTEQFPSFAQAREHGKILSEAYWTNYFRNAAGGKAGAKDTQSARWIMMNKFGWSDKKQVDASVQAPKLVVEFVDAPSDAQNKPAEPFESEKQ